MLSLACLTWFVVFSCLACKQVNAKAQKEAFKFLVNMPLFQKAWYGGAKDFNCTTNDPNATVSFWMKEGSRPWKKRELKPKKLVRKGDVFTLLKLDRMDAYAYRCQAVNSNRKTIVTPQVPSGSYLFLIEVKLPSYDYWPAQAQFRQVGEQVKFTLISKSNTEKPKIYWKKTIETKKPGGDFQGTYFPITGNHIVTEFKNDSMFISTLVLYNLTLQDEGIYTAFGSYRNFKHVEHFRVQVFEPSKPRIYKISPLTVVKESQKIILKCNAFAYPPANIVWFKDGKTLPICNAVKRRCKNALYEFIYDKKSNWTVSTLTIRKIKYQDSGTYLCRTKNLHGQSFLTTKVFVKSRPVMSNRNKVESIIKRYGIRVKLECQVSRGYPQPTFQWFYQRWPCADNGLDSNCRPKEEQWRPFPSSIRPKPPTNQPTMLSRIILPANEPPNMAAYYKCQASNELGEDSVVFEFHRYKTGRLEVLGIEQGQFQSLNAGEALVIQCFVRLGYVAPQSMRWFRDGKELSLSNDSRISTYLRTKVNNSRVIGDADQAELVLTVKNATVSDSAIYKCKAAQDQMQSIRVNVKAVKAPKLKWLNKSMEEITVLEGNTNSIELRCGMIEGNPKPNFLWFKDGQPIFPNENQLTAPNCKHAKDGMYFFTAGSRKDVIICGDPLTFEKFSGSYTCRAENKLGVDEIHSNIKILAAVQINEPKEESKTVFLSLHDDFYENCQARGHPPPVVEWRKMEGDSWVRVGKASTHGNVELKISELEEQNLGNYSCVAKNWHSFKQHFIVLQLDPGILAVRGKENKASPLFGPVAGCVAAVLFIVAMTILVWRFQKRKMNKYSLTLEYSHYEIDPDKAILEQVNDMPYDPDWEFREDRLVLSTVIGSGAFGQVVKAEAMGILAFSARDKTDQAFKRRSKLRRSVKAREVEKKPESWKFAKTTVAVKMLKESASESEYRDLASEIKIMIHIGEHPNIINILGACTRSKRLMLIMEYAPHGNLLKFLREKRALYQPTWKKTVSDPNEEFTLADLLMAAYQIARGMEFLASKKCIHRDLAARNVLIGDDYVMKIADFGLARDVYKNDEYVKQTSGLLPVKWMALESLFDRVYTEKSDVWSFGIVLWEIFTLGGTPYPGLPTEHLLDFLSEGKRMGQPHNCPTKVYNLMKDCWILQAECRPTFALLSELLGKFLEKNIRKDNPYIVFSLEDALTGNNYYQFPRRITNSSSAIDLEAGPSNFEPIESPLTARKEENKKEKFDASVEQSHVVHISHLEEDLPPSYDEALKLSKVQPNHLNLSSPGQDENKMANLSNRVEKTKYSSQDEINEEGSDIDSKKEEQQRLLNNSYDNNQNKIQNSGTNDGETVIFVPTNQFRGPRRARCESEV